MNPNVLLHGNAGEAAETLMNAQEVECEAGALVFPLVNALRRVDALEREVRELRSLVTPITR